MATLKEKLAKEAEALGAELKGSETTAELKEIIATYSGDDSAADAHDYVMPGEEEKEVEEDVDDSVISEKDHPHPAFAEHNRLKGVYRAYKKQNPEKWDAEKKDLLARLEAVKPQLRKD